MDDLDCDGSQYGDDPCHMPQTKISFRAEGFEATATMVVPWGLGLSYIVVESPGRGPHSLKWDESTSSVWFMSDRGWKPVLMPVPGDVGFSLALAISLLYSVPGVEVVDGTKEAPRNCQHLSHTVLEDGRMVTTCWICKVLLSTELVL